MIEKIYNRIVDEVSAMLNDKGYTIFVNQGSFNNGEIRHTIWWNTEKNRSILFCWHPLAHEFELCRSSKKGKPKLKGFAWEQVYSDSYRPKAMDRLEEADITSIISYFTGELDYTLKRVPTGNKPQSPHFAPYDRRRIMVKKTVLVSVCIILFIPMIIMAFKNNVHHPTPQDMYYPYRYKQLYDANNNGTATTKDSTAN